MKILKNNLDEMQEQRLLKIEHNACWLAFWGLLASIFIQMLIYRENYTKTLAGEWIVFMCLSIYILAACLKDGIWDRRLQATPKVNLIASAIAGFAVALINFFLSLRNYGDMKTALLTAAVLLICTFLPCFAALSFFSALYKKRRKTLESGDEAVPEEKE